MRRFKARDLFIEEKILNIDRAVIQSDFKEHSHDFCELFIILGGTARHRLGRQDWFIRSGDIAVLNPGINHSFTDVHKLDICNIMFLPFLLEKIPSDLSTMPGYQALFRLGPKDAKHNSNRMRMEIGTLGKVESLVAKMLRQKGNRNPGSKTLQVSAFLELVVLLSEANGAHSQSSNKDLLRLAVAVSKIEGTFREDVDFQSLSQEMGVSYRHFTRLFKENYGLSPGEYVLRLRLNHAVDLLRTTDLPVTDVAYDAGFSDSNLFSRQFRNQMGLSPRDFRRKRG